MEKGSTGSKQTNVWTVLIGYKTMKKEVPFLNGQKDTVGSLAYLFL